MYNICLNAYICLIVYICLNVYVCLIGWTVGLWDSFRSAFEWYTKPAGRCVWRACVTVHEIHLVVLGDVLVMDSSCFESVDTAGVRQHLLFTCLIPLSYCLFKDFGV